MKMRLRRTLTMVAAGLAVSVGVAACGSSGGSTGGTAAGGDYVFGASLPVTGSLSALGLAWQGGLKLAFDEANAAGVNGHKVVLKVYDDKSEDPAATVSNYRAMVNSDHALAGLGFMSSSANAAVVPTAQQSKMPIIGTGVYAPYTDFMWGSGIDLNGTLLTELPLVQYLAKQKGVTKPRVASINVNTQAGLAASKLWGQKTSDVLTDVGDRNEPLSFSQYSTEAAQIMTGKPGIIAMALPVATTVIAVRALRQAGFTGPIVDVYYGASETLFQQLDDANFYAYRDYADPSSTAAATLVSAAQTYGVDAKSFAQGGYFTTGYVIGKMVVNVLKACGAACTRETFAAKLASDASHIDTGGLTGQVGFSPDHHAFTHTVLYYAWDPAAKKSVPAGLAEGQAYYSAP